MERISPGSVGNTPCGAWPRAGTRKQELVLVLVQQLPLSLALGVTLSLFPEQA